MNSSSLNTSKYVDLFLSEARDHIHLMEDILIRLPHEEDRVPAIQELFRHAHSLEGMSASMGYGAISHLTHVMEDIFSAIKNKEMNLTNQISHQLMESLEHIHKMLAFIEKKKTAPEPVSHYVEALKNMVSGKEEKTKKISAKRKIVDKNGHADTYDIAIHFCHDAPLLSVRAILVLKRCSEIGQVLESSPSLKEIRDGRFEKQLLLKLQSAVSENRVRQFLTSLAEVDHFTITLAAKSIPKKADSAESLPLSNIRIKTELLDHFLDGVIEIMIQQEKLARIIGASTHYEARYEMEKMGGAIKKLYSDAMKVRMLPFSFVSRRFGKSVRELASRLNKKVSLKINGGETELDRSILEDISDPINHIIRNSIDHGIEDSITRKRLKKDKTGRITISLVRKRNSTEITIEDDGCGIDTEKVKRLAYQEGLISKEKYKHISDQEALMLVTIPGFSTVKKLTALSGRGIGLDIVRTTIENLGGKMKIRSRLGGGTSIIFTLPLTVAMINAFIVRCHEHLFAIPVSSVEKTIRVDPSEITCDERKRAFLTRDGRTKRIFDLSSLLSLAEREPVNNQPKSIFLFKVGEEWAGLAVDEILARKSIIVKPLGHPLDQLREYSGASLLERGRIALILDISNIVSI